MRLLPRLLLSLLVLSVAGCAQPDRFSKSEFAQGVLPGFAFDRFEALCIANIDTPQRAVAQARTERAVKVGNGELREVVLPPAGGKFLCVVDYAPGVFSEALKLAKSRFPIYRRDQEEQSCVQEEKSFTCTASKNGAKIHETILALGKEGRIGIFFRNFFSD